MSESDGSAWPKMISSPCVLTGPFSTSIDSTLASIMCRLRTDISSVELSSRVVYVDVIKLSSFFIDGEGGGVS
jgi:hypothetical protein